MWLNKFDNFFVIGDKIVFVIMYEVNDYVYKLNFLSFFVIMGIVVFIIVELSEVISIVSIILIIMDVLFFM